MDYISAIAEVQRIIMQCMQCTRTLAKCIAQMRKVDTRLESFSQEILALQRTQESLKQVLELPSTITALQNPDDLSTPLWNETVVTLKNCSTTMTAVNSTLDRINKPTIFGRPLKKLLESLTLGDLSRYRQRIELFNLGLQVLLRLVSISMALRLPQPTSFTDSHAQLEKALSSIQRDIASISERLSVHKSFSQQSTYQGSLAGDSTTLYNGDEENDDKIYHNLDTYVDKVERYLLTGSISTTSNSLRYSNVQGRPITEREVTDDQTSNAQMELLTVIPPTPLVSDQTVQLLASDETEHEYTPRLAQLRAYSDDQESDKYNVDLDLIRTYRETGQASMAAGTEQGYLVAAENFYEALDLLRAHHFSQRLALTSTDVHLLLAQCCLNLKRYGEVIVLLEDLIEDTQGPRPSQALDIQILEAQHLLGEAYFRTNDLERAKEYSLCAFRGRKEYLNAYHKKTRESVQLVIDIYQAMGKTAMASAYSAFLDSTPSRPVSQFENKPQRSSVVHDQNAVTARRRFVPTTSAWLTGEGTHRVERTTAGSIRAPSVIDALENTDRAILVNNDRSPKLSSHGYLTLFRLVRAGDMYGVKSLLEGINGTHIRVVSKASGETLLPQHAAAWSGYADLARVLLEHGTNPMTVGRMGTVLQYAAWNKCVEVMAGLLPHDHKGRLSFPSRESLNCITPTDHACAMLAAAQRSRERVVRLFLDANAHPNDAIAKGVLPIAVVSTRNSTFMFTKYGGVADPSGLIYVINRCRDGAGAISSYHFIGGFSTLDAASKVYRSLILEQNVQHPASRLRHYAHRYNSKEVKKIQKDLLRARRDVHGRVLSSYPNTVVWPEVSSGWSIISESSTKTRLPSQATELSISGSSSVLCKSDSITHPVYKVSFKCACGALITDRYTEIKPGGISKLLSDLNQQKLRPQHNIWRRLWQACTVTLQMLNSNDSFSDQTSKLSAAASSSVSIPNKASTANATSTANITALQSNVHSATNSSSQGSTSSSMNTTTTDSIQTPTNTLSTNLYYLLLCFPKYVTGFKLYHEVLPSNTVKNDRDMFELLRQAHLRRRKFVSFWLGLRTVTKIYFTAFDVDYNNYVDLKPHLPTCSTTAAQSCVLPPPSLLCPPDPEYSYAPELQDYCPPRGPAYMAHYFQHPEEVHEQQRYILEQIPKHLRGQLCVASNGPARGWGLSFEEGLNYWPLVITLLLPSLVIGVVWSVLKRDVQGGFGVAAYCVSTEAILLMYFLSPTTKT